MGYPNFNKVEKIDGPAMGFEKFLQQINLLYPNLPELYEKYAKMVYEFNGGQLERQLELPLYDMAADNFYSSLEAMANSKLKDNDTFMQFVEHYELQDIVKTIFEIKGGKTFEEWLQEITTMIEEHKEEYSYFLVLIADFLYEESLLFSVDDELNALDSYMFQNLAYSLEAMLYNAFDKNTLITYQNEGYEDITYHKAGEYVFILTNTIRYALRYFGEMITDKEHYEAQKLPLISVFLLEITLNELYRFKDFNIDDFYTRINEVDERYDDAKSLLEQVYEVFDITKPEDEGKTIIHPSLCYTPAKGNTIIFSGSIDPRSFGQTYIDEYETTNISHVNGPSQYGSYVSGYGYAQMIKDVDYMSAIITIEGYAEQDTVFKGQPILEMNEEMYKFDNGTFKQHIKQGDFSISFPAITYDIKMPIDTNNYWFMYLQLQQFENLTDMYVTVTCTAPDIYAVWVPV